MLKITEGVGNDISTVYAYYTQEYLDSLPEPVSQGRYPVQKKKCDFWSCFDHHYQRGSEREFIESIASDNYSSYHIAYCDCN